MDFEAKLRELQAQREEFVRRVDLQVAYFDGQIALLAELIAEQKKNESHDPPGDVPVE